MPSTLNVNGIGSISFQVAPYFTGTTGTYLLDIKIQRTSTYGINEKEDNLLQLFPNPASGILYIRLENNHFTSIPWVIMNNFGQTVLTGVLNGGDEKIDISILPSGIYVFSCSFSDRHVNKKFIHDN
ncbi:MAG: T9SS type A sorting domain-containing protein [Saprospiraceae bacterium]|nr:T9SS type A sorting domain-containing protein [Saprospiraceae bacterium]